MCEKKFRDALEREAVDTGTQAFLDGTDRPFDFPNMAISGDHVQNDGEDVVPKALKLIVHVKVTDKKTAGMIQLEDGMSLAQNCLERTIGDWSNGPETDISGTWACGGQLMLWSSSLLA